MQEFKTKIQVRNKMEVIIASTKILKIVGLLNLSECCRKKKIERKKACDWLKKRWRGIGLVQVEDISKC